MMNEEFNDEQITRLETVLIFLIIIAFTFVMAAYGRFKFRDNSYINVNADLSAITMFLNDNADNVDTDMLYGHKTNHVYLVKNKDFKEVVNNGKVIDRDGVVTRNDIADKSNLILNLNPFIEDLKLKNTRGYYVSVTDVNQKEPFLNIYYVDDPDLVLNKIDIRTYFNLIP